MFAWCWSEKQKTVCLGISFCKIQSRILTDFSWDFAEKKLAWKLKVIPGISTWVKEYFMWTLSRYKIWCNDGAENGKKISSYLILTFFLIYLWWQQAAR